MPTPKRPNGSPALLMLCGMMALAGCETPALVENRTPEVTATEAALCRAWRDSLPGRSRQDTAQTQAEIGTAYDVQAAACPAFARFGPQ